MSYVIKLDYSRVISKGDLTELLLEAAEEFNGKSSDKILSEAEEMAEAEVKKYLGNRFEISTEFALDASDPLDAIQRDNAILRCFLNISVYFLHFTINPRDIPELREAEFNRCVKMLEGARDGTIYLELAEKALADGRLSVFGGATKFISKPFEDYAITTPDE